ncbi:MAG TPA: ABC-F family ATP-binding cassette domain-containing protein [Bdellovibrionales bacterium]|nr:ABC-F family ATP-binding cassette domain-containing protein [Bdellovibrionales bacterium]
MIHLTGIAKGFGTKTLYRDGSLQVNPGDKIGLVGPNGAGKTTIFRIIMKEEGVDEGSISIPDKTVIGYFSQDIAEMKGRTALAEVMAGAGKIADLGDELKKMEAKLATEMSDDEMASLLEKYGEAQAEFEARGGYDLESRAKEILTGLGIGPDDHDRMVEHFSGGWKMRIMLAKILALNPDVLLADEPTNHLDMESIIWLEEWLRNFKGAVVMTSHDRTFMNRIVTRIVEVANKTITTYGGNYDFYEKERDIRREQLIAAHARQQEMLAKEEEFIARFAARASHAAQVQSRVKKLEKIDRIEIPPEEQAINFAFAKPPRGGDEVVKFNNLSKTWTKEDGSEKLVFSGATALVKRLDRIAVVGVNGAGKSTLLKCVTGQTQPTSGTVTVGASVQLGYFSQSSIDVLHPEKTIYDEVHDRIPHSTMGYVKNLLGAFLFSGDDSEKKVRILSGGEKSRVILATILANPVNLLVLDEPTNHLDIRSREVLLEAIKGFDGTVMIVSHDRHFLSQLATRVFEVDRNQIRVYDGGFDYYLWKKAEEAGKSC